jgi:exonuclease SbcC
MRPVKLRASGFGALRDPVEIDFSESDFFALVGPTGSGKSTVIDAICFALFGAVPRYGEQASTAALSSNTPEARIEFTFQCGDTTYRIVRVVRRKGATKAQLDRLDGDGSLDETLASSVTDVKASVADLVGLNFDQFTKCVVLPQGQFSALLHEPAGKRTELLTKLLDHGVYRTIASAAGTRASELTRDVEVARRTLVELDVVDPAAIELAAARLGELREVEHGAGELSEQDAALRAEFDDDLRSAERLAATTSALGAVCVPDGLERAVADHGAALAAHATAVSAVSDAGHALDIAAADLAALGDPAEAGRHLAVHEALAKLCTQLADSDTELSAATAAHATAQSAADMAAAAVADRSAHHERLRDRHLAHAVAVQLTLGEPCPVCEQTVTALPHRARLPELDTARAALEQAQQQLHDATSETNGAAGRLAAARHTRDELGLHRDECEKRVATLPSRDELQAVLDAIDAANTLHRAARDQEARARKAEAQARATLDAVNRAQHDLRGAVVRERERLAGLGLGSLPDLSDDLAEAWHAISAWADDERQRCEADREAARRRASTAARRRAELVGPLRDRLKVLGVETESGADLPQLVAAARTAVANAEAHHSHLVSSRIRHAELNERVERDERLALTARTLAMLLDARHFQPWLMRRAVHDLAARATAHLAELTGGRYALTIGAKDEFCVIDHANADDVRSARSLSGGETFQASLALALALAEQVAELSNRGTGALESIFLDEGFGTLDPDALDAVAGTIEQLGAGERVVGLVTHVPALAERVPVRFRVSNDGRTSTIEREVG